MRAAIVIVTYEGEHYLRDLFDSLRAHTDLSDVGIIVVDNASRDGTMRVLEELKANFGGLRILPQKTNTGFAGGNNIGLREARAMGAPYAVLLNQDLVVTPGWLEPLIDVMDRRPEVAAAQPVILLHSEPDLINSAGNSIHFCGFGYCGGYRKRERDVIVGDEVRSVPFASGAALVLRLAALDRSGDFDELLFLYHEDCDLQIRLRQIGYDCALVPTSHVFHKYEETFSPRKYALLDRNRWLVLLKDWPTRRLIAAAPALAAVEIAVLVFAARQGWFGAKLRTYPEVARLLPLVLRERREVQARRVSSATDGRELTPLMQFAGLDHPIITNVANPALAAYWGVVRKLFDVP